MSQNKYMHPRNIYKNRPNFKHLAISYPEFRKFTKQDLRGKVTFDFKNPEALKALTTALLQKDFGLQVEIPSSHLIPTLPLRLNYLLWMEDLIHFSGKPKEEEIRGVDIGCGATCIYPLLAATTNKWKMLATEKDHESVDCARRNVAQNGLEEFITVKQVEGGTILKGSLDTDHMYDFTMCNPPFFSSERDADSNSKSRSHSRTPPRSGKTGSLNEMVVQGGEVAFIRQMIQESAELRNVVKIYSSMVGQKSSLDVLKSELKKVGVASSTLTEFCQGHVIRWGLGWTFLPEVNLEVVSKKKKKDRPPLKYIVPIPDDPLCYTVSAITSKLKALFTQLQIEYKMCKGGQQSSVFEFMAHRNTWSHQRQKRRQQKKYETQQMLEGNNSRNTSVPVSTDIESGSKGSEFILPDSPSPAVQSQSPADTSMKRKGDDKYENNNKRLKNREESLQETDDLFGCIKKTNDSGFANEGIPQITGQSEVINMTQNVKVNENADERFEENKDNKRNSETADSICETEDCNPSSSPHILKNKGDRTESNTDLILLNALVSVSKVGPDVIIEMVCLQGTHGRESMHQVMQYIKNNLKI